MVLGGYYLVMACCCNYNWCANSTKITAAALNNNNNNNNNKTRVAVSLLPSTLYPKNKNNKKNLLVIQRPLRSINKSTAQMTSSDEDKKVNVFETEEDLSVSLAKYTAELSDVVSRERGSFSLVLSGGSLIKSLRKLVESPYIDSVDWSRWHVFWVDERVVPKDHEDSNYKLAYDGFLSKVPIPPGNVYAINDALSAEGAAEDYETCIKHLVKTNIIDFSQTTNFPKFDLMLLGMGPDGHVASLFPGHPLVHENKKWVTFIKDSPKPPPDRITFTFPVINSSANIALVVAGSGKAHPVSLALGKGKSSEVLPVQMVEPEGELVWFLDKGAASNL